MNACADRKVIRAYEAGQLADHEAARITEHVAQCPNCRAVLQDIRHTDPDAGMIRRMLLGTQDAVSRLTAEHERPGTNGSPLSRAVRPKHIPITSLDGEEWPIPDYQRIVRAGEGAYGEVWVVRDRVGVHRALKIIDLQRLQRMNVKCRERAALEAYCRKITGHPYLVSIFHVGEMDRWLYYTMELADDRAYGAAIGDADPRGYRPVTMASVIERQRMQIHVAIEIARRLLRGLAALHHVDLVHRDIKPSNIIFVHHQPKLADIGMITADTYGSRIIGTPRYMPPDRQMDKTADVYAFGKVLFEMITSGDDETFPLLPDDPRWHETRWPRDAVQEIILNACAEHGSQRYPHAEAMLEDIERLAEPGYLGLFEDLVTKPGDHEMSPAMREAIRLGHHALRTIPWIAGLIGLLAVLKFLGIS